MEQFFEDVSVEFPLHFDRARWTNSCQLEETIGIGLTTRFAIDGDLNIRQRNDGNLCRRREWRFSAEKSRGDTPPSLISPLGLRTKSFLFRMEFQRGSLCVSQSTLSDREQRRFATTPWSTMVTRGRGVSFSPREEQVKTYDDVETDGNVVEDVFSLGVGSCSTEKVVFVHDGWEKSGFTLRQRSIVGTGRARKIVSISCCSKEENINGQQRRGLMKHRSLPETTNERLRFSLKILTVSV